MNARRTKPGSEADQDGAPRAASNEYLVRGFWRFARLDRARWFLALPLMALTLFFELCRPFLLKSILDRISRSDAEGLKFDAILLLFALLFEYLSRAEFNYLVGVALVRTINRIREALFGHVLALRMAYFDHKPVGGLLTRTINDTEALEETLKAGAVTIALDALNVIGMFAVLMCLDLPLSLAMMAVGIALWLIVRWFGLKLREQYLEVRVHLSHANAFMAEGIGGVEIVQVFNHESACHGTFREINRAYSRSSIERNAYDAALYSVVDGIAALAAALILHMGFGMRFGLVEVSAMIVYLHLVDRIFVPIRDFSGKFAFIQQALAALDRVFALLDTKESISPGSKALPADSVEIEFQNVGFSYQAEGPQVLSDVSFRVKLGQTLALVGATGSGKSTIGKLLTRAYEGYTGGIFVNGEDIREIDVRCLRSRIAVVQQEPQVFPGSLRDNISMFDRSISDEAIDRAVDLVKAGPMVSRLADGLDHEVKENGANLSAGQIQLVNFARALVRDAPVVLMDEATSNVDSATEAWIQEALVEILRRKTVIVVAHRLSTVAAAEIILVMERGRIVQRGNHGELMRDENGHYARLIESSRMHVS